VLTPVGEHELFVFWIQLTALLFTARVLGGIAQRFRQPSVVGELSAGLLLGPSVLGSLAPDLASSLFPGGEVQSALLLAVSWLGIVLLLAVTGFETDLRLLRRLARDSAAVSLGSLFVPLVLGVLVGLVLPASFLGENTSRGIFAAFMAVALSISALPVVAKILGDMGLMRRDLGQITIAAGIVNDIVGWLLLGGLVGVVTTGAVNMRGILATAGAILGFLVLALTVGQRAVNVSLRLVRRFGGEGGAALTTTLVVLLGAGAITHAIGMEVVIGAFVAGIVLGQSRYLPEDVRHGIEQMSNAAFAPIYFATAGLYMDLRSLTDPRNLAGALAVLAVATAAKTGGAYLGGRISGMDRVASVAVGVGLNARGAMEIVLATIGLSLGVLNEASYTAIAMMAIVTSMTVPPLLRPLLRRVPSNPEEEERLKREELLAGSVIASAANALLPTRGGENSLMVGRMLDLVLQPEAHVTIFSVRGDDDSNAPPIDGITEALAGRSIEVRRTLTRRQPAEAILEEAALGYDLLGVGLNEEFRGTHELSEQIQEVLAGSTIPILLVRRPATVEGPALATLPIRRVIVPVTGTLVGLASEEIAYTVAARVGAAVDAVHVVSRPLGTGGAAHAQSQLTRTRILAGRFGRGVSALMRTSPLAYEELLTTANERDADLIVLGAQLRSHEGRPFLGHGTEYLLEHAPQAVAVVVYPSPS